MKPIICFSVIDLRKFSIEDYPFVGYELKPTKKGFFNVVNIKKYKEKYSGKELSLHSQLSRILSCNDKGVPKLMEAELLFLKSEIIVSKILGIKEINFHMKQDKFSTEEIEKFNEIIDFAKSEGVELIYENHVCSENAIFQVLEAFPRINFCLDIGHLNYAIHNGKFKMDLEEFIKKVKPKLVHIHAHNNHGERDEHNCIDNGTFQWEKTLELLKGGNLRKIIIENREEDCLKSKKILEEFYSK